MKKKLLLLFTFLCFYRMSTAQPEMVKVISKDSKLFTKANNVVFFVSNDYLMKTDGTSGGTVLVKSGLTNPSNLQESNNLLYFVNSSSQLWRSDGTMAGTYQLKSFSSGQIRYAPNIGSYLFFSAKDGATGNELYRTDGTVSGTILLQDINSGSGDGISTSILPTYLVTGSFLYFQASNAAYGKELWRTDGTTSGTQIVKDVNPGSGSGYIAGPWQTANGVYFSANDGSSGLELWKTDGTSGGTFLLKDINTGAGNGLGQNTILAAGSFDYFIGNQSSDSVELWKTNGTTPGTSRVKVIYPSPAIDWRIDFLYANAGTIYFAISDYYQNKIFLWESDGSTPGTAQYTIVDNLSAWEYGFKQVLNGIFYTPVYINGDFVDLLVTDGTSAGTFVKSIHGFGDVNVFDLRIVNNQIVFGASGQNSFFRGYYKSDGTSSGSGYFTSGDIYPPQQLLVINNKLYFAMNDGPIDLGGAINADDNMQLFESDLSLTQSLRRGCGTSYAGSENLLELNGKLIFTTYNQHPDVPPSERIKRLWIYDPQNSCTTAGTKFTLINADTDADISGIASHSTLSIKPTDHINIRYNNAITTGSVIFYLNGSSYMTQNSAPYTLAGDNGTDYYAWNSVIEGTYTLIAKGYSGSNGTGTQLYSDTLVFTILIHKPFITHFVLQTPLGSYSINNGSTIDINSNPQVNITAQTSPLTTGSVRFNYNNGQRVVTENTAPYSLWGDNSGVLNYTLLSVGTKTLTAVPYTGANGTGYKGDSLTITFTVINSGAKSGTFTERISLISCTPNPATEYINIQVNTENASFAKMEVYDINGILREVLYNGSTNNQSSLPVTWNVRNAKAGIYILKTTLNDKVYTERLIVK